jgi:hypothetical protein
MGVVILISWQFDTKFSQNLHFGKSGGPQKWCGRLGEDKNILSLRSWLFCDFKHRKISVHRDASEQHVGPIIKGQAVQVDETDRLHRNVYYKLPFYAA